LGLGRFCFSGSLFSSFLRMASAVVADRNIHHLLQVELDCMPDTRLELPPDTPISVNDQKNVARKHLLAP
jgi:hypothetical protein